MTTRELNWFPELPGTQKFPRIATLLPTNIFLIEARSSGTSIYKNKFQVNYTFWHLSFSHTGTVMSPGKHLRQKVWIYKMIFEDLMGQIYKIGAVPEPSAFSFAHANMDF